MISTYADNPWLAVEPKTVSETAHRAITDKRGSSGLMTSTDRKFVLPEGPPVPGSVPERDWGSLVARTLTLGQSFVDVYRCDCPLQLLQTQV